jgi:hypothetical protein
MASSMIEESNNCYRIITEKEYNRRQLKWNIKPKK